jgi:hypothetical protein
MTHFQPTVWKILLYCEANHVQWFTCLRTTCGCFLHARHYSTCWRNDTKCSRISLWYARWWEGLWRRQVEEHVRVKSGKPFCVGEEKHDREETAQAGPPGRNLWVDWAFEERVDKWRQGLGEDHADSALESKQNKVNPTAEVQLWERHLSKTKPWWERNLHCFVHLSKTMWVWDTVQSHINLTFGLPF